MINLRLVTLTGGFVKSPLKCFGCCFQVCSQAGHGQDEGELLRVQLSSTGPQSYAKKEDKQQEIILSLAIQNMSYVPGSGRQLPTHGNPVSCRSSRLLPELCGSASSLLRITPNTQKAGERQQHFWLPKAEHIPSSTSQPNIAGVRQSCRSSLHTDGVGTTAIRASELRHLVLVQLRHNCNKVIYWSCEVQLFFPSCHPHCAASIEAQTEGVRQGSQVGEWNKSLGKQLDGKNGQPLGWRTTLDPAVLHYH